MAFLTLSSSNPDFSYIIQKNPETVKTKNIPFSKTLRKGRVYGWFSSQGEAASFASVASFGPNSVFKLWFFDAPAENSFSDRSEFEYLDTTRYSGPYVPIAMITALLNTASNTQDPKDVAVSPAGQTYVACADFSLQVPLSILYRVRAAVNGKAAGLSLTFHELAKGHCAVSVLGRTVFEVLNLVQFICCLASMDDENTYIPLPEAGVSKYLKILNRIQAPYALRYMFLSKAVTNGALFQKLSGIIQTEGMTLHYGNTQTQRFTAIRAALNREAVRDVLVDLGCGELYHSSRMSSSYKAVMAFDADADVVDHGQRIVKRKQMTNVQVAQAQVSPAWIAENAGILAGTDVLLSEVLEHNSKEDATAILQALIAAKPDRIIITVPNKDFNVNYNSDPAWTRHPDHLWEPTQAEFQEFISVVSPGVQVEQIGDVVAGASVSLLAVIKA